MLHFKMLQAKRTLNAALQALIWIDDKIISKLGKLFGTYYKDYI